MSNTVNQKKTEQMIFHFTNEVKRQNLQETTETYTQGTRLEDNYDYTLQVLKLVDYNTKGLFQNIIYTTTLIKKGLLNISIDIYLEHIINKLIHNYKFQIVNEFSLLRQFIDYGNRAIIRDNFEFHKEGINYAYQLFRFVNYCNRFTECQMINNQRTDIMRANVGGWDAIIDNFEAEGRLEDIQSYLADKKPFILKEYSADEYIIEKVCNKILKVRENGMFHSKKQIKKSDIQYVKVLVEPEQHFTQNFNLQTVISNYRMGKDIFVFYNVEDPTKAYNEFQTFCENTTDIIDYECVFDILTSTYNI